MKNHSYQYIQYNVGNAVSNAKSLNNLLMYFYHANILCSRANLIDCNIIKLYGVSTMLFFCTKSARNFQSKQKSYLLCLLTHIQTIKKVKGILYPSISSVRLIGLHISADQSVHNPVFRDISYTPSVVKTQIVKKLYVF